MIVQLTGTGNDGLLGAQHAFQNQSRVCAQVEPMPTQESGDYVWQYQEFMPRNVINAVPQCVKSDLMGLIEHAEQYLRA